MIRAATSGASSACDLAHAAERVVQRALEAREHLRAAPRLRQTQQQLHVIARQAELPHLVLDADEVAVGQLGQDPLRGARRRPRPPRAATGTAKRRRARRGSSRAPRRRARRTARRGPRRCRRRRGADQLDPGLQELARLAALRADAAIGVRQVTEAQRRLRVGVARRDQPGDRDRHVGAQHQHVALLVEHPIGRASAREVDARKRLLVLERRGVDLAVSGRGEHMPDAVGHRAQLAHLVGQDVARSAGDAVDHRSEFLTSAESPKAHACTGASSRRVIRAPRSRNRSSIRS